MSCLPPLKSISDKTGIQGLLSLPGYPANSSPFRMQRQKRQMKKIFYIMGKSATGKDHIYRALAEDPELDLSRLVLYTTRPRREKEENGREYFFTDQERLQQLRTEGKVIEERVYHTVSGDWYYFTADEGQIDLKQRNYLGIGTLESYERMREYFGGGQLVPIYIETEDGLRLERALKREKKQKNPNYEELCRRYLADCADFSPERITEAGIERRFSNNGTLEACVEYVKHYVRCFLS